MKKLRGFVHRFDKMLASGWAISETDPSAAPAIEIVQNGRVVITLRPAFEAPELRARLNLPPFDGQPLYAWRLWLPLTAGILPDCPTDIRFKKTGRPLRRGAGRVIELAGHINGEALSDIASAVLVHAASARGRDWVDVHLNLSAPRGFKPDVRVLDRSGDLKQTGETVLFGQPRTKWFAALRVEREALLGAAAGSIAVAITAPESDERRAFHASLRAKHLPRTLFDASRVVAPIPEEANIARVSRPAGDVATRFLVGGATTFRQIEAMAERFGGMPPAAAGRIVDWGVGCARVARCFWELADTPPAGEIIGLDIDEVNIDWCRRHLQGRGRYEVLPLTGFNLDAGSVDLLYGISVMTHLSERHQFLWLEEIRRVLKPGGLAILTTHGEYSTYRSPALLALPFVDKFGFFDGVPDASIGADRDDYYRAAFHSRGYVRKNWGEFFEILDIIPAANALNQDFVVLKKA